MPRSPFPLTPVSGVKRSRSSFEPPLARRSLQRILKGKDFLWTPSQFVARDTVTPMGFRTSVKANGFAGAGRASTYQKGQSHRRTEEHGDLNTYNRVFQFYNYHADKDILLDEMCRGLVLSVLRIAGGTVQEYDEPIAWPAPLFPNRADHAHHSALSFHFKDNRRFSSTFGKTLSSFSGRSLTTVANVHGGHLPDQYDAEVYTGALPDIPATWVPLHDNTKMYSLTELAAKLAIMFSNWIAFTQDISDIDADSSVPKGIDILPCRMQLLKTTTHQSALQTPYLTLSSTAAHEVEYDDIEFGDSKVDVSAYTSVKLHNVTPASGNVLLKSDPMGSDNITHVPLKGKMYVFSGPVPKVWDKHRAELQHLFKPEFFKAGRYLLPNSRLHSTQTEEFRTPPRGRFIWSNCVDEHKITMAPGGMQELKLNYRVKTSIKDFWYKYRDDDLSSSKLGKSICVCLEPSMRRMHINTPIPVVHVKEQLVPVGGNSQNYSGETRLIPIEYQPYEWKRDALGVTRKQIRQVVTLGVLPSQTPIAGTSPAEYSHPGVVPTIPWFKKTVGGVVVATITQQAGVTTPLMWDEISTAMITAYPELQSFVSRGDPMMFNVQINRNYGATCSLRNSVRLGADKTGVKRKYHEKMISNMGDVNEDGFVNDADMVAAKARGDIFGDHELETATGAGVRQLVLEGDAQNTALPSVVVNVTGGGSSMTAAQLSSAMTSSMMNNMDTDNVKAGLQMDISQLDDVLANNVIGTGKHLVISDTGLTTSIGLLNTALVGPSLGGTVPNLRTTLQDINASVTLAGTQGANAIAAAGTQGAAAITAAGVAVSAPFSAPAALIPGTAANSFAASALAIAGVGVAVAAIPAPHVTLHPSSGLAAGDALDIADAIMAGGRVAGHVPIDSGDVQIGVQDALTVQDVRVINAPGTSLTADITGNVNVINAPNTQFDVDIHQISATAKQTMAAAVQQGLDAATGINVEVDNHPASTTITGTVLTSGHPTHLTVGNALDSNGDAIALDTSGHPTSVNVSGTVPVNITQVAGTVLSTAQVPISGASGGLAAGDAAAIATAIEGKTLTTDLTRDTRRGILIHVYAQGTYGVTHQYDGARILVDDGTTLLQQRISLPSGEYLSNTAGTYFNWVPTLYANVPVVLHNGTLWKVANTLANNTSNSQGTVQYVGTGFITILQDIGGIVNASVTTSGTPAPYVIGQRMFQQSGGTWSKIL
jgi:hypothetical protein